MKFLVFQHAASEHPGSLRDLMRADGLTWDAVELDEGEAIPDVAGYDALLVLGGPMDVWEEDLHPWLATEKKVIREWVTAGRPFLGVCLGHQLLADAMGGEVGKMAEPEVGVCDIRLTEEGGASTLFSGYPQSFPALQWHGAAVFRAPVGAKILASNAHCPIQAMQIGPRAFGIQYHVELIDTTVSDWGTIPEYRCALESITGPGGQERLEAAAAENMEQFRSNAARLYRNFSSVLK